MDECTISEKRGARPTPKKDKDEDRDLVKQVKETSFEALVARNTEALRRRRRK